MVRDNSINSIKLQSNPDIESPEQLVDNLFFESPLSYAFKMGNE